MSRKAEKERVLPEGWREVRLGEVGTFSKGIGITKGELVTDGVPCVRYGEIYTKHNYKIKKFHSFISNEKDFKKLKLIKDNDLLFAGSGETREEIGKCVSFNHNAEVYAGGDVIVCSIKPEKLRADFASYYLNTLGRNQMGMLGQGDSIVHIYGRFLKSVTIPVPSLPEQKTIASLLETWDTAIEKTEALIEAKEKQFKWLLKRLISDQQDNPEWREVRLGEVFGKVLIIEKGKMLTKEQMKSGNYPVVAGGQVYAGYHNEFTHNTETITISGSGAYAGFVWFHNYPIFATDCNVITAKKGQGVTEYFYYAIKNQQNRLYDLQSGGAQPHIYSKDIATLQVMIPPIESQKQIVYTLNITRKEINLLKRLTEQYCTQKRGLMQKLLTGEWRTQR